MKASASVLRPALIGPDVHFPPVAALHYLSTNISFLLSPHDLAMPSVSDFEQTMVLVACGPYTTSDSITYDPLLDLITIINHDRPDVCILVGPWVVVCREAVGWE